MTLFAQQEQKDGVLDLSHSIGARIRQNGVVQDVFWNSATLEARMVSSMKIAALDGEPFTFGTLRRRLQAASPARIRLTVISEAGEVEQVNSDYVTGFRFPHLEGNGH